LLITNSIIKVIRRLNYYISGIVEIRLGRTNKLVGLIFRNRGVVYGRFICLDVDLEGPMGVDVYTVFDVFDFDIF